MTTPGPPNPCPSVQATADYCGVSRATMYRVAAQAGAGALPVVELSPNRRGFRQSDLDAWLDSRTRRA